MDAATRGLVRERAGDRCEYCRLPQRFSGLRFHVEHIVARQHGGTDELSNLALSCPECNLHKGTNLTGIDPDTGQITPLFHPRQQNWDEHFLMRDGAISGKTAGGRATAWLLQMNIGENLRLRQSLFRLGILG